MRGIPGVFLSLFEAMRITPACAGNTSSGSSSLKAAWDHPRVCGEYIQTLIDCATDVGSPPRVRGILKFRPLSFI